MKLFANIAALIEDPHLARLGADARMRYSTTSTDRAPRTE